MNLRKSRQFLRFVLKPILFLTLSLGFIDLALGVMLEDLGPDPHKTLLLTTGEWALICLMLTLSISPLVKWLNWPILSLVRRMCGLFVAFYATLHLWVYIQYILAFDWQSIFSELTRRPYISIGFIAWLLLLPLAVTSNQWSMKRLGRRWKKLHKLTYIIAMLAVWHFAWQVKLDLMEPIFYIIGLVILLGWRDRNRLKFNQSANKK